MAVVINGTTGVTTPTESVATTIGVGGATPSASGAGISFPATQNPSSNANTLDDYEEGTWTPVINRASTSVVCTYSTQIGTYVKIGSMVHCQCFIAISAISNAGSGLNQITGLPFTAASTSRWTGAIGYNDALPTAAFFYVIGGNPLGYFGGPTGGNPNANWTVAQIYIGITYQADN